MIGHVLMMWCAEHDRLIGDLMGEDGQPCCGRFNPNVWEHSLPCKPRPIRLIEHEVED